MSFKFNSNVEFTKLLAEVEDNIDSLEKCNELFENFLSHLETRPSITSERIELAVLLLCAGRYQESYNIIRKTECNSEAEATDQPPDSDLEKIQQFWLRKSPPCSVEASEDEDLLEDVDWLLPQPQQPATSPYQWLYIGQIFLILL